MNDAVWNNFMRFTELTDRQCNALQSHLPKPSRTCRPRADDITANNAAMFVLIAGCRWIDLPIQYGSKSSAYVGFQQLQEKGIWKKILKGAIASAHRQDKTSLQKISVDSSSAQQKMVDVTGLTDSKEFQAQRFMLL